MLEFIDFNGYPEGYYYQLFDYLLFEISKCALKTGQKVIQSFHAHDFSFTFFRAKFRILLPFQISDCRKAAEFISSRIKPLNSLLNHSGMGALNPIFMVRVRTFSGICPFIASLNIRLENPSPTLELNGRENT